MKKINVKEIFRTIKYALVAASAGIIQIGTFTLFNEVFHWEYWLAYLISLALSVIWNLTINRKATFKSNANYWVSLLKVIGYYCVFTPLSVFGGNALVKIGWNEYLVEVLSMLINFVTEFLFMTFVVFRGKIDNNVKSKNKEDNLKENN